MGVIADLYPGLFAIDGIEESLYESDRTRVIRISLTDGAGTVIYKKPLGQGAARRLRHEKAILERLAGVDGVVQLAAAPAPPGAILMADRRGASPAATGPNGPMKPVELLELAANLASVLAAVHGRGVVHKDITPANLIRSGSPPRLWLIDFDLATTFVDERPAFTHQSEVVGTLAYLAPEQTGRTGWPVDQRADMYGLGATLYELATGGPPFGTGDALQLIHDHLTKVPVAPIEQNPAVPAALSEIILRLLEKEPDQRYQSAQGLAYDLFRLRDICTRGADTRFVLGQQDFPLRLSSPSRLIGRDREIAVLGEALTGTVAGHGRGVLASGAPGVGKTMLLNELRPMVTTAGGWFVTGKFDQYLQNDDADAVRQALRGLGRLLLAEPEGEIVELRARILDRLGANAGLAAAVLPEFALLLEMSPDAPEGDPLTVQARLRQAGVDLLRAIASPRRPVVIVVDDLQWAATTPLGFVDAVLVDEDLPGVLLVGAYRDDEVDAAHPLTALLSRWQRLGVEPRRLRLSNLPVAALDTLLGEMLRIGPQQAAPLAAAIGERTDGNPFDTVELVNALRRDGALTVDADGWHWDLGTIRRYLGHGDVVDLLNARIDMLPAPSTAVLEVMACLGGEVGIELLCKANGLSTETIENNLLPALEDGLLVMDQGGSVVRFRHDRVQQATLSRMTVSARTELHLTLARALAGLAGMAASAAEQYFFAVDAVRDPAERRRVADLFRTAAGNARSAANHNPVERFVTAAIELLISDRSAADATIIAELATERHAVLNCLGRLDEADEVYQWITELNADPLERTSATWAQVSSLTSRGRAQEAVTLGLDLMRHLGRAVPTDPDELGAEISRGMETLYHWTADGDENDDLRRPELDQPRLLAIATTINVVCPAAYFSDPRIMAWLVLEAGRMWAAYGPAAALVGPLSNAAFITSALRGDYRTGNVAVRRVLAVSEARGYEPETSQSRFLYALSSAPWFEPLEDCVRQAQRSREGLVRGGVLFFATATYYASVPDLVDCAPTLDGLLTEVEAALALSARTGNDEAGAAFIGYRQFVRAMRGETDEPGGFTDATFDVTAHLAGPAASPTATANVQIAQALAAALFGDFAALARHTAAAMPLMPFIHATYLTTAAHLLQAMTLADRARAAAAGERAILLGELDVERDWLAGRAEDAPGNFRHLLRLVEAERAWAVDDFRAAAIAFDTARRDVAPRHRPWHRALIVERTAQFHLAYGIEQIGHALLAEARDCYETWGATAKVADLDRSYPVLRTQQRGPRPDVTLERTTELQRSMSLSTNELDLVGILKASQALSSETNLDRLRDRVTEILGTLTGATAVRVVLWNADLQSWFLAAPDGDVLLPVEEAAGRGFVALSAFRYAERTREPLVVEDATRDDRFSRDPYFARLDCCSLLVVPVLTRGVLKAVLVLENRLSRTAFSAGRLDGVNLIAGQLAVSLDNALLYASLEGKVADRTEALATANRRLETLSTTDPLTGLANRRLLTDVLAREWQRAAAGQLMFAIAMIDIDHFKLYNDRYGHPAGDQCLRRVAAVLNESVRSGDLVARYGGEEFAVVLPDAGVEAARRVGQRIRDGVIALDQPHDQSPYGFVTVSVGVAAVMASASSTPERLIESADGQLYQAKHGGRNKVMTA